MQLPTVLILGGVVCCFLYLSFFIRKQSHGQATGSHVGCWQWFDARWPTEPVRGFGRKGVLALCYIYKGSFTAACAFCFKNSVSGFLKVTWTELKCCVWTVWCRHFAVFSFIAYSLLVSSTGSAMAGRLKSALVFVFFPLYMQWSYCGWPAFLLWHYQWVKAVCDGTLFFEDLWLTKYVLPTCWAGCCCSSETKPLSKKRF